MDSPPPTTRVSWSWSIYGRSDITQRYEILGRLGSGAYSDVYRGCRISDGLTVALKEIHDYQSAFREIEALQALRGSPNVVELVEYFWQEDEDAVLVLEFLPLDLASVIGDAKRQGGGIPTGEVKQWMLQIVRGLEACHRISIAHRDLKPSNLFISHEGVLKLADFGQARILQDSRFIAIEKSPDEHVLESIPSLPDVISIVPEVNQTLPDGPATKAAEDSTMICEDEYLDEYLNELDCIKAKYATEDPDTDTNLQDDDASCLATCTTGDMDDDLFKGQYSYEAAEDESGNLTSFVGTRWFRAPELLYGSTNYGQEIDLWSLGCIFAELLTLQPLFPGISDIDQIGKIVSVLGDLNEDSYPGCSNLPDYNKLSFRHVENPSGLETNLPNRFPHEVNILGRLLCYYPASRGTAMELLQDDYFCEEPLPVPLNQLRVPSEKDGQDVSSEDEWGDYKDIVSK